MAVLRTTAGQLELNAALPPHLRRYDRTLDKKGIQDLFRELAAEGPDAYRAASKKLLDVGRKAAYASGGMTFGLRHLRPTPAVYQSRARLDRTVDKILADPKLDDAGRRKAVVEATREEQKRLEKELFDEAKRDGNPFALQVLSGARGDAVQMKSLLAGDHLYSDAKGDDIPFPVQESYAEGLSPASYYAGTFGGRRGLVGTKLSVADGGDLNKRLIQAVHRLLVVAEDDEDPDDDLPPADAPPRGLPVDADDDDNIGALLAAPVAGFPRDTVITPQVLAKIRASGAERLLVRSPLVGGPATGVYAKDVGVREHGRLPTAGDGVVGIAASQSLAEKLTQGALGSKHGGGVSGSGPVGMELVNQLIEVPQAFRGGAAHAEVDGRVDAVEPAPQGGFYVSVNGQKHYVDAGREVTVKPGDSVEAGDLLSTGIPNPQTVVEYKGGGEGRRAFLKQFYDALKASKVGPHRRNVELVVRGLIDHVEMTDETDDHVPGDVVPYQRIEKAWRPREGYRQVAPKAAVGQYLERPVLHHTVGTKVRPSMLKDFEAFGVKALAVHSAPPPFRPVMVRARTGIGNDPDWMTRMLGGYQEKNLLSAVHRGAESDLKSTSFVPSLAEGSQFGVQWPGGASPKA
jgi:hypothetical protein